MYLCTWALGRKRDDAIVLVEHLRNTFFSFYNFVEGRIAELLHRNLRLLSLRLLWDLSLLGLGSPATDCEDRAGLAELRKDQIAILVKALQFLTEAASKGKALNADL